MLGQSGMNVEAFRGRADLAPVVARASVDALGLMNNNLNERELEQRIQQFAFDMNQAAQGPKPTAQIQNFEYGQANPAFNEWLDTSVGGAPTVGTSVLTGRDANGNLVPLQASSAGGLVQSQLPDGVTFDPGALNAERAAGNVIGKGSGQAALDLPAAQAEAERIAIQIGDLKAHRGLDEIFGKTLGIIPNQWGPTMPGSNKANAMARIEQMTGNAFLNGRQLLKGGGAITDFESKKAEAAFARLSTAQTKEEFIAGMDEFQAALEAGIAKLAAQSGNTEFSSGVAGSVPQPGASGGWEVIGVEE